MISTWAGHSYFIGEGTVTMEGKRDTQVTQGCGASYGHILGHWRLIPRFLWGLFFQFFLKLDPTKPLRRPCYSWI